MTGARTLRFATGDGGAVTIIRTGMYAVEFGRDAGRPSVRCFMRAPFTPPRAANECGLTFLLRRRMEEQS